MMYSLGNLKKKVFLRWLVADTLLNLVAPLVSFF